MAEATHYMFSHEELVGALLRQQGIHTGFWTISIEFTLGVGIAGPDVATPLPTAMASVARIGIQQANEPNQLTFDAARLNPAPAKSAPRKATKRPAA